jgi:hypothetical protein
MFQATVVEKIKTYFMFKFFFPENRAVYEIMSKYGTTRLATDDNTMLRRKYVIWMPVN